MSLYYKGKNPAIDIIAYTKNRLTLDIVVIKRKNNSKTALPGGFIDKEETPLEAAVQELKEETNLTAKPETFTPLTKRGRKGTLRDPRNTNQA